MADSLEHDQARVAFMQRYNTAVDLANSGDRARALKEVDALLEEMGDDDLCQSAAALREWLTVNGSRLTGPPAPRSRSW